MKAAVLLTLLTLQAHANAQRVPCNFTVEMVIEQAGLLPLPGPRGPLAPILACTTNGTIHTINLSGMNLGGKITGFTPLMKDMREIDLNGNTIQGEHPGAVAARRHGMYYLITRCNYALMHRYLSMIQHLRSNELRPSSRHAVIATHKCNSLAESLRMTRQQRDSFCPMSSFDDRDLNRCRRPPARRVESIHQADSHSSQPQSNRRHATRVMVDDGQPEPLRDARLKPHWPHPQRVGGVPRQPSIS